MNSFHSGDDGASSTVCRRPLLHHVSPYNSGQDIRDAASVDSSSADGGTNQLSVEDPPPELVRPNLTMTSTEVVNPTSVDSNIPEKHSESTTMVQVADDARQPIAETPHRLMALEDGSSLTMAIIRKGFLGTELSRGDCMQIQMDIDAIIESQSDNDFCPRFDECKIEDGALIVCCANEATVQWLTSVVENNNKVFSGMHVIESSKLRKIRVAYRTRDTVSSDPAVFLKRLQRQNANLRANHWTVAEKPSQKESSQLWIFKIDQVSADAIKAANMTAYTGLFKGTFEFLADVESPREIVAGQEAECV